MTTTRRSVLQLGTLGAAAIVGGLRGLIDPFGLLQASEAKAVPGFSDPGESFGEFVLLPFGAAPPPVLTPPSVAAPASEGGGALGFDAFMSAAAAARTYHVSVPVLDAESLPNGARSLVADETYVRVNAQGQLAWCSTRYRGSGHPDSPSALTMRLDNGVGLPVAVGPSGSPSSGIIPPEKAGYLPEPGVVLVQGPGATAMWVKGGALFTASFDSSLLPGVSLDQLAQSFAVVAG